MSWYLLVVGILAAWRATHLLGAEDGPWDALARLRRAAGAGMLGRLLDCFYCLSLWTAIPLALVIGQTWTERVLLWPALSAGAIILERLTTHAAPTAAYTEDSKETTHGMLRKDERPIRPILADQRPTD
jgi:Protein of unknown function (DUF1360)